MRLDLRHNADFLELAGSETGRITTCRNRTNPDFFQHAKVLSNVGHDGVIIGTVLDKLVNFPMVEIVEHALINNLICVLHPVFKDRALLDKGLNRQ